MLRKNHYGTVTEALEDFRQQGFTVDFNLEENYLICDSGKFGPDEFEIKDIYRYEGDTDPADEATVYAIESRSGLKGVLVTGYGVSSDSISAAMLRRMH
jgi:hypothetical protein